MVSFVDKAVGALAGLSAQVEEIEFTLDDPISIMQPLWSVALALGVASMTTEQRALVDPPLLDLAEPGFRLSALEYRRLEQGRENFGRRMAMLHAKYDLLVTPQLATTAFAAGHEVPPESQMKRWWEWSPFTYPFNLTQQPAAAVPCGFTQSGYPCRCRSLARSSPMRLCCAQRAPTRRPTFRVSTGAITDRRDGCSASGFLIPHERCAAAAVDLGNQKQYRAKNGAILNWWESTGDHVSGPFIASKHPGLSGRFRLCASWASTWRWKSSRDGHGERPAQRTPRILSGKVWPFA